MQLIKLTENVIHGLGKNVAKIVDDHNMEIAYISRKDDILYISLNGTIEIGSFRKLAKLINDATD